MNRTKLVACANDIGRTSSRANAPLLTEASTREEIQDWMQWCDPNGCHTDEQNAWDFGHTIKCPDCVEGWADEPLSNECLTCEGHNTIADPEHRAYDDTDDAWHWLGDMLKENMEEF